MSVALQPFGFGSLLYVPAGRPAGGGVTGFLFPIGSTPPPTVALSDALKAQGWFLITGPVADSAVPAFVSAAQTWFASSARNGAVLSWFINAAKPGAGLAGWTIFAGLSGSRSALTGTASIQFGNFAISLPRGTLLAASTDGTTLAFTAATSPIAVAVTPFGARTPVNFPITGPLLLNLAGDAAGVGCAAFSFATNAAGLDSLDVGMRSYSAPPAGGYAQTALHRPFDFSQCNVTLAATLDPLDPTNHDRSFLVPASGTTVPSFYRSAAGPAWHATFGSDFSFVLASRLAAVDSKGTPVPGNPVYTIVPSGTVDLALPGATGGAAVASTLGPTLMGGLSPVEYFNAPAAATLVFVPDQPAFAPTVSAADKDVGRTFGALTGAATTAWASIVAPSDGTAYFSQPDQAVLHQGGPSGSSFLAYLPMQISTLPAGASTPFPLLPYGSVAIGVGMSLHDLGQFERQAWSPKRLATLQPAPGGSAAAAANGPQPPPGKAPNPPCGTTRQGLLLRFGDQGSWADLTLAMSAPPPDAPRQPGLILQNVAGKLRAALQTNELFLVVSAGDLLLADSDMAYELSTERVDVINPKISDQPCQQWLLGLVKNGAVAYPNLAALKSAVLAAGVPPAMASFFDIVRTYAGDFSLFAAGAAGADAWEFDLSPWRWAEHQTILIFKFCNKKLSQAAADPSQWSAGDAFNANTAAMAQQIGQIIVDARTRQQTDTDLTYFVDTVLDDPSWNGIIALNALVPLSGLPEQMRALAAGIDPAAFKAHHVGVSVTPVTPGAQSFTAAPSSIFGLIDYQDPAPLQSSDDYAFKVNTLKVLITNSQVAGFSSQVELLVNKLFGERVTQIGASDNNLGFNGYYQKSGDTSGSGKEVGTYRFVTSGPAAYTVASRVLEQVAITGATFVTLPGSTDQNPVVNATFQLDGAIAFLPQKGFDLFSYGPETVAETIEQGLCYRSLAVEMSFNEATPSYQTFAFDASKLVVDPATSLARAASLVSHFPMKLTALIQGLGSVTPDSLGFMPVEMPIQSSMVSAPWFALRFDLDLGTPGALAAATGFNAGLLLAWAPNSNDAAIYCGLSLPGVSGGQRAISLEGVISLVFGGISFVVAPPTYLIQLRNIALKFLSVSFPPNGQINMTLFGNPAQQTSGAIGWFAAYVKNGAGGGSKKQQQVLQQQRRARLQQPEQRKSLPGGS
ncbi:hypothetical protein C8R31_10657 [Nitrosospira sp. Nsp2]|uniref:hemagglutinin n=1 Tax=Nitrosospira sp. Nsp2 TaxID=136548 RepID=UPI000D2FA4F8|nr:hemagglutinin [Nitrosospira sp. Nsp2]PTR14385.1 hypothetical protein C8R31_10657 [Nitrosospira sp. Nsp2]